MQYLKQSTAKTLRFGPFLDDTDGKTAETGLSIAQADIRLSKNGGAFAQTNDSSGATHDENGWYYLQLDATDTNTLGPLSVAIHESGALPVFKEFMVVSAHVYDSMCGSDYQQVDVKQWASANVTKSPNDLPNVNVEEMDEDDQSPRALKLLFSGGVANLIPFNPDAGGSHSTTVIQTSTAWLSHYATNLPRMLVVNSDAAQTNPPWVNAIKSVQSWATGTKLEITLEKALDATPIASDSMVIIPAYLPYLPTLDTPNVNVDQIKASSDKAQSLSDAIDTDDDLIHADMLAINGDTDDAADLGLAIDNSNNLVNSSLKAIDGNTSKLSTFATACNEYSNFEVDVKYISEDSDAADNLESILDETGGHMTLKSSTRAPFTMEATGGNFPAMSTLGHGTAAGMYNEGGADGGHGQHNEGGASTNNDGGHGCYNHGGQSTNATGGSGQKNFANQGGGSPTGGYGQWNISQDNNHGQYNKGAGQGEGQLNEGGTHGNGQHNKAGDSDTYQVHGQFNEGGDNSAGAGGHGQYNLGGDSTGANGDGGDGIQTLGGNKNGSGTIGNGASYNKYGTTRTGNKDLDADEVAAGSGDWTSNELTEIKTVLGITGTGTPDSTPSDGVLKEIQDNVDAVETDTQDLQTQIGTAGAGLTDLGGMSTAMKAEVNAEADTALSDYDPPTKAEMDSGFAGLNDLSAAQVNAEVDTALADIHLDHLLAVDYDPASKPGVATALLNELVEDDSGVSRFTANALEQAPSAGGDATAANQTTIINHLTDVKGTGFVKDTHSLTDILADVTGLNGAAMRGTDNAALASVCTETRLAELDAGNLPSDIDDILEDTGTTIPAQISGLNNISQAEVNAACDTALADYDGPTRAEATADKDAIIAEVDANEAKIDIIDGIVDLIQKYHKNRREFRLVGSDWFQTIYDDDNLTAIVNQEVQKFGGDPIDDLTGTGTPSIRVKSTV